MTDRWILCAVVTIGALVACTPEAARAEEESAAVLVQRLRDSAPDVSYVAEMKITTPGGLVRAYTASGKELEGDLDARYIEVTDPFNLKDTRFLFFERDHGPDEQFMYLPAIRRVLRMTEKNRREPFLGSTFFVVDMVPPSIEDFTYRYVGTETVGGRDCRLVESTPKRPKEELYGRSVFAIDPEDLVVTRSRLFDQAGKPFKLLTVAKLEKVEGHWTAMHQRMKNLRNGGVSELSTVSIDYDVPLEDETFHIAHVGR